MRAAIIVPIRTCTVTCCSTGNQKEYYGRPTQGRSIGRGKRSHGNFSGKKKLTAEEKKRAKEREKRRKARAKEAEKKNAKRQKERNKRTGGNKNRRNVWLLIVATLLVIGSVFMFTPPNEKINQGLDIQGGLSVVLSAKSTDGQAGHQGGHGEVPRHHRSRVLTRSGASEATVQVQGNDQILVQIPGLSDPEKALATIGKTGKLEFARARFVHRP